MEVKTVRTLRSNVPNRTHASLGHSEPSGIASFGHFTARKTLENQVSCRDFRAVKSPNDAINDGSELPSDAGYELS